MHVLKLKLAEFVTAPNACHFARVRFTEQRSQYLHTHDFSEVFWVENGQGWHGVNGQRRPLRAGMVVFVRAEDQHDFTGDAAGGVELATWRSQRAPGNGCAAGISGDVLSRGITGASNGARFRSRRRDSANCAPPGKHCRRAHATSPHSTGSYSTCCISPSRHR